MAPVPMPLKALKVIFADWIISKSYTSWNIA